jgi:tetratricopeptide (TPR) repeat protein
MTPSSREEPDARLRTALAAQYEIVRLLGVGGMGRVWLARDLTLEREVAIKVVADELGANPLYRERFLREARTVARLRHDGIVNVYSAGEAGGQLYFVMEFVRGESLRELMVRHRRLPVDDAVPIVADVARALSAAHAQGVVHRDVKPENILLHEETGRAMVTDFGVAQAVASSDDGRMTATGMVVGSPRYMSPEQAVGDRDLDGRSDQYALGLVAYEMLSGSEPFEATSAGALLAKRLTSDPAPLSTVAPDMPTPVSDVVMKALARERDQRWPDCAAFAAALEAALAGEDPHAAAAAATSASPGRGATGVRSARHAAASPRSRFPKGIAALVAVVLLSVLGFGAWKLTRTDAPRRPMMLVLPFELVGAGDDLEWLSEGAVSMLTLDLAHWQDLDVVDYARTLDLLRAEKLENSRIGPSEAQRIARATHASSYVLGRIVRTGDSLTVVAGVYGATDDTPYQTFSESAPASDDPRNLFDRVARDILQLSGAPEITPSLAHSTTSSLAAYRDYLAGLRALNAWQLDSADRALASATARDSGFALAYYKRALVSGWRNVDGDVGVDYARLAVRNADRLTPRDRALVEAYLALSEGLAAAMRGEGSVAAEQLGTARQRYEDILSRDSLDAEAWYGLGDAYFHLPQSGSEFLESYRMALRAFDRTLALDSTFHLAYQHKLNIYQLASLPGQPIMLEGDSLVAVPPGSSDTTRIRAARQRASEWTVREARHWVNADPDAASAHRTLAEAYATARDYASAAGTLRRALARPSARDPETHYALALYELSAGRPAEAMETLDEARTVMPRDSLVARGSSRSVQVVAAAAGVMLHAGRIEEAHRIAALAGDISPTPQVFAQAGLSMDQLWRLLVGVGGVAAGLPWSSAKPVADSALTAISRLPDSPSFSELKKGIPILVSIVSGDSAYLSRSTATPEERQASSVLRAWLAMEAGDTAAAIQAARSFPRNNTSLNRNMLEVAVEAEILYALGDLRGALESFEAMQPSRYGAMNLDPGWAVRARSLARRAQIHEALGERQRAIQLYEEFVRNWENADEGLQPQVRAARERLSKLRDAGATRAVGANGS